MGVSGGTFDATGESSSGGGSGVARPVTVDNIVVLEIGNRRVKAGFAGDAAPRCIVPAEFGWQRVARTPSLYFGGGPRSSESSSKEETEESIYHNLWNLRDMADHEETLAASSTESTSSASTENLKDPWYKSRPLKRFETVLEVILVHIFSMELLVDPRQQRVAIVENPMWPSTLRESIAKVCLKHLHVGSIVFLESPVLDLIAAGLRSGIVVDVGWEETTVYAVYDLRVLLMNTKTSTRGSKMLHKAVGQVLEKLVQEQYPHVAGKLRIPFSAVEAVVTKALYTTGELGGTRMRSSIPMMVIPSMPGSTPTPDSPRSNTFGSNEPSSHQLDITDLVRKLDSTASQSTPLSPTTPRFLLEIPNQRLQTCVTRTFLHQTSSTATDNTDDDDDDDDDELDLPRMISQVILSLSMDIRGASQSTIIFVGSAATGTPGLPSKVLQETRARLRKRDTGPAASSVMAARSMGSWTGASLYMSSLAWYFAQDERIRLPGELSRERFASVGYVRSTVPFGVVW